jgi:DNA-binding NtrC family response regulator
MKPILIIEDDRDIRETLQNFLEVEGFNVISAENGKKALEKVQDLKLPQPSLIFLDLFMPQMSGLEFLKHYARMEQQSPVVLCSACPTDHAEFIEARSYTNYAISKPLDIDKVLDLARRYSKPLNVPKA